LITKIFFLKKRPIAPKIPGKGRKIMGWKKGINLLRWYKTDIIYKYTSFAPIDIRVNTFCDYVIDTYIDKNASFPPYLWSPCNISGERTTNACKAFHSAFGKYFIYPIQIFLFFMKL
jgi:hypothetical protein